MTGVVTRLRLELARRNRRHDGVGVDLPVRMLQGHADLDAAVLEREDVLHVVAGTERRWCDRPRHR